MKNKELETAKKICKKIESQNHEALLVGGCVRDIFLGLEPSDVDIATNFSMDGLAKHFRIFDIGKSKKFGICVVVEDDCQIEVANYRTDGNYSNSRRPDSVQLIQTFEQDAKRRDFTINALAMRQDGKILDYVGGIKDLENRIIRTVGNPKDRFEEDKLRILRLARFAAKLDFEIEKETKRTAKKMSKTIDCLAMERITEELKKAAKLGGKKFSKYIQLLDELKVLQLILPEIHALKFKPETPSHHPEGNTTFKHTLKALESAEDCSNLEILAILFHDIGKGTTYEIGKCSGKHTYYSHDSKGIPIMKELGQRMKFSSQEIKMFCFCIENHMKFHRIPEMKRSKIVKLAQHQNFPELTTVCCADSLDGIRSSRNNGVLEKVEKAMTIHGNSQPKSLVSGNLIMKLLNLEPGKEVGRIKKIVTEQTINEGITEEKEIEKLILKVEKGE